MSKKTVVKRGGVSFAGLLTILFIGLKLTGNIAWSWLWVLSPLWIGLVIALVIFLLIALGLGVALLLFSDGRV